MRLVRNTTESGRGKYMLVLTRKLDAHNSKEPYPNRVSDAIDVLTEAGILDDPYPETEGEFFVLRLRDRHAQAALHAYANSVGATDAQFAAEVRELADRAGPSSPWCKEPD